jgi:NADH dehydrogenase/NADH:ubiquinone oxidoreductase subunit G
MQDEQYPHTNALLDPELTNWGACRLCVVEVEGMRNLVTSCTMEVQQGDDGKDQYTAVREARKTILELIVATMISIVLPAKNG